MACLHMLPSLKNIHTLTHTHMRAITLFVKAPFFRNKRLNGGEPAKQQKGAPTMSG